MHSDSSDDMLAIVVPADDESYPFIRSMANYAASKLSSLSESDISLLADDALSRLIEYELNRLPEDELNRLADAAVSPFLPIAESIIASIFSPFHSKPEHKEGEQSSVTFPQLAFYFVTSFLQCFAGVAAMGSIAIVLEIFFKRLGKKLSSFKLRHEVIVPIIATQEEKLKLSKRSIFLSKTKYSRTLDLKGLKGIGETYIQETDTGFRQGLKGIGETYIQETDTALDR
ncbi:uncharacterized protein LOC123906727 isoform X2 [Trifolium pratense]|uniref:uncharacterized protein LOC123906727 isoform X2 n=1 Tax=Trifolium pratense TaxID=57577 RepID=UPI001E692F37|nr:uncharacterized protein LOC123906727 isoform X2 [Trifolium pratense]